MSTKIIGTGSYIPEQITTNADFLNHHFHNADGSAFEVDNNVIIEKFKSEKKRKFNIKFFKYKKNIFKELIYL